MSKKLTNSSGIPYYEHQDSQTVGARGPVLLQDFILQENLAHFVRRELVNSKHELFLPDLAITLNNYGILLHKLNRYSESKKFLTESIDIYRKLTLNNNIFYLSYLSRTLNNLSNLYIKLNRYVVVS